MTGVPYNIRRRLTDAEEQAMRSYVQSSTKFTQLARAYGASLEDIDTALESEAIVEPQRTSRVNRTQVLRAQIANMQRELTELERFPADRFEVGTAVLFDKQFEGSDQVFHYAAIKASETHWYVSGVVSQLVGAGERSARRTRVPWEELTYFMKDATNVRVIFRNDGQALVDDVPVYADASSFVSPWPAPPLNPLGNLKDVAAAEVYRASYAPDVVHAETQEPPVRTPVRDPSRD